MLKTSNPHNLLGLLMKSTIQHQGQASENFSTLGLCSCVLVLTYLEQGMFYQNIQLKSNVIADRPLNGDV